MTKHLLLDLLETLFIGIAVFALVYMFLAEPLEVTGDSMYPTLHNNEQIITEKVTKNFGQFSRGDIVVFYSPAKEGMLVVKRLIALPGDTVELKDSEIWINNSRITEPYLANDAKTTGTATLTLNDNEYYVLGDNRENSTDSRNFGPISKSLIIGKAVGVYYPLENLRLLNHIDLFLPSSVSNKLNNAVNF